MNLSRPLLQATRHLPLDRPFTRRQAVDWGVPDRHLHALVRVGYLIRPVRSVYVVSTVPDSLELRTQSLELVIPAGGFVTDHTAAWLHGGPAVLPPNAHLAPLRVEAFRPPDAGRMRTPMTSSGERTLLPRHLMTIGNLLVTTPLRTAMDLGRLQRNLDVALWGIDSMLRTVAFELDELLDDLDCLRGQRGIRQLRVLAPMADPGAESFAEAALRLRWYDAGLPRPTCQIPVLVDGKPVFWLDLGIEDWLFAAEYDGRAWHSAPDDVAYDRERRLWLTEERHWMIEAFTQTGVFGRHQDATDRLRAAAEMARKTVSRRLWVP